MVAFNTPFALEQEQRGLVMSLLDYLNTGEFPQGIDLEAIGAGDLTPGAGPLLQSAFDRGAGIGTGDQALARSGAIDRLLSGENPLGPNQIESIFERGIKNPTLQTFNQDILPAISARLGGRNAALGPAAAQAFGRAGADVTTGLAQSRAGLELEGARFGERALDRLIPGINASVGEEFRPISVLSQLGGIERSIRGEESQERLRAALLRQPFADPRLGFFGQALSLPGSAGVPGGGGGGGSSGGGVLQTLGSIAGLFSGGASFLGGGGGLF